MLARALGRARCSWPEGLLAHPEFVDFLDVHLGAPQWLGFISGRNRDRRISPESVKFDVRRVGGRRLANRDSQFAGKRYQVILGATGRRLPRVAGQPLLICAACERDYHADESPKNLFIGQCAMNWEVRSVPGGISVVWITSGDVQIASGSGPFFVAAPVLHPCAFSLSCRICRPLNVLAALCVRLNCQTHEKFSEFLNSDRIAFA